MPLETIEASLLSGIYLNIIAIVELQLEFNSVYLQQSILFQD